LTPVEKNFDSLLAERGSLNFVIGMLKSSSFQKDMLEVWPFDQA